MTDNVKKKTCKDCKYFGSPIFGYLYCRAQKIRSTEIDSCWRFEQKQRSEGALTPKGEYIKEIQTSIILLNQVQQLFKLQNVFEEQEESEEPLDYAKINFHCAGDFDFTVRGTDVVNFLRDYLDQEISYNLTRLEVLTEQLF